MKLVTLIAPRRDGTVVATVDGTEYTFKGEPLECDVPEAVATKLLAMPDRFRRVPRAKKVKENGLHDASGGGQGENPTE